MSQIIDRLGPTSFVRIHRSAAVNLAHVRAVKRGKKGLEVELSDGMRLPISRRNARDVVDLLRRGRKGTAESAEHNIA
jgi:DNA-binding LytR/AlgR family response regulator